MSAESRPPSKPWRVYGARGISKDYTSKRRAYEAVESIAGCGTRPGVSRARVFHWDAGSWKLHETIEPIPPEHVREAVTVGEFLEPPQPGVILADCSCGAEYTVPQGADEYGALEEAHRKHVQDSMPSEDHHDQENPHGSDAQAACRR